MFAYPPNATPFNRAPESLTHPDGPPSRLISLILLFLMPLLLSVHVQAQVWTTKAPLPVPRTVPAAAAIDGKLYALGGDSFFVFTSALTAYDPVTDAWVTLAPMPTARAGLGAAKINGKLYAVGGQANNGAGSITAVLEVYDPATNTWTTKAPMPTARSGVGTAEIAGKLYVVGGLTGSGFISSLEVYDPATDTWAIRAPMPTARSTVGAAAIGGKLYVVGGHGNSSSQLSLLEVYDPGSNTWTTKASMATAREALAGAAAGGKFYALGGWIGGADTSTVEVYDPVSNSWSAAAPMSRAREHFAAVTIGNRLYAAGGYNFGFLSLFESLEVVVDVTPPVTTAELSSTPSASGWYNQDVTVSLSSDDDTDGSGVSQITFSATGAQPISQTTESGVTANVAITAEGETTITYFATDAAGNTEAAQSLVVKIDKSAPSVSCDAADGSWHADDVDIPCSVNDSVSGLSNAADSSFNLSTNVPANTETANASTNNRSVCDIADNCASAGPISGNKVDKKAPTITITTPSASASYLLNQLVASSYTCSDGGSGVGSCAGPVASGSNIDTASAGGKTFTVNATDQVGNIATPQSVSYTVGYGVVALYDQTKVHKSGSTVPIKIQIVDANGVNQSSASLVVQAMSVVLVSANSSGTPEDAGNSNPDLNFRYDASLGGYIFNLKTTGFAAGTYELHFVVAGDARDHVVQFRIRP